MARPLFGGRRRWRSGMIRPGIMPAIRLDPEANGTRVSYGRKQRAVPFWAKCPRAAGGAKGLADATRGLIHEEVGVLRKPVRSWMYVVASAAVAIAPVAVASGTASQAATHITHAAAASQHMHIDCST